MRVFYALIIVFLSAVPSNSKDIPDYPKLPEIFYKQKHLKPETMSVLFADGSVRQSCVSAQRLLPLEGRNQKQRLRLVFKEDGMASDTIITVDEISFFLFETDIGGGGEEYRLEALPVREYDFQTEDMKVPYSYLEISGFFGYSQPDDAANKDRNTGFDNYYYGGEFLIAPFGKLLGPNMSLGLGIEALFENSRLRIPVKAQLRYTFGIEAEGEKMYYYFPDDHSFGDKRSPKYKTIPSPEGLQDMSAGYSKYDETSYIKSEFKKDTSWLMELKPYFFIEGGPVFNGDFQGAGPDPSDNPEDYGQYFAGLGAGIQLWDFLTINIGYRYMRLNVRSMCSDCDNIYLVNTNAIHSALLKIGVRLFEW